MALLAAWNFDEASGPVLDRSGNGRDWTLDAELSRATGHTNTGLVSSTGASMPTIFSGGSVFGQTTDRTVMAWVKGTGETWHIVWVSSALGGSGTWGLLNLGGAYGVRARNASGAFMANTSVPVDGLWHHMCGTYKESTSELKFYLDGSLITTTTVTGPLRTDGDTIQIAEWGTGTTLDDVRIFDECLDSTAISTMMNTPVTDAAVAAFNLGFFATVT